MKIYDEYKSEYIEIQRNHSEDYYYPSVNLEIKIKTRILEANIESIWVERKNIEAFIDNLTILDETRKGKAILVGMSPERFKLELVGIDDSGHLGIGIRIENENFSETGYNNVIQTGFKIDAGLISLLITDLKRIIKNH